jgi:hypothetical protein
VCVFVYVVCGCVVIMPFSGSVFDFRLRVFEGSCHEGVTEC